MASYVNTPVAQPEAEAGTLPGAAVEAAAGSSNARAQQVAQTLLLAMLFAAPALMCVHAACVTDLDIWWHLRTGQWILAHHALPRADPFSGLAGKSWLAYSWLYDLLVLKLFYRLGLTGLVAYSAAMVLAITVALFHLVRRLQRDISLAVLLTFATVFSMARLYTPRPWMFTILFFILELDILMQARRRGRVRELLWLPIIFALWANVHIVFVDGLFVLGLAWAESLAARRGWSAQMHPRPAQTRLRPAWIGAALAASALATLANPFGWHIYRTAYDLATQAGALNKITELQAMPFRGVTDFLLLFFALASAAALGWQRRFLPFETALLSFAAVLAFRSQRDVWILAVAAAAVLASTIAVGRRAVPHLPRLAMALAVLAAVVAVPVGFRAMRIDNAHLQVQLEKNLPVRAVQAVQAGGYAGPLYNDFNWGGYLIWALRMPVSIDGRQNLYGDQRMDRSVATWNAQPDWDTDEQLKRAGLVIGPVKAPLIQLLRMDPRFQLAYEDKVAAVFVARR